MLAISSYTVEQIRDPFGIIAGNRYEFMINLEIPEEDELYSENGVSVRAVVKEADGEVSIVTYDVMETTTQRILEFDLEDDEEEELAAFCKEHLPEG
ncbi:hypothetical protein SAMN04487895_102342 [Paenibacillus sophorae]|uniref:Pullulanase n=1 Tax=Paenibacillus sophorae TaxID=1333845 RepID=A0A1H8IVV2_9BACL|nr:DUF6509 family protein [Paenibacillus sophorae]QWU16090.1 pullulanase [Paenibacillus sophorae]SEN72275.1 hypothetical protein SAMN04487895_102342 [Paenibacillus sophorae]